MQIGVIGFPDSWYVAELQRAAEQLGHVCQPLEFPAISAFVGSRDARIECGGIDLAAFDAVIVRTMPPGSLEQVVVRMDLLARLEAQGTIVLNSPKAIECAVDKFLTTARLASAGLPVPRTVVCESSERALEAFEQLGGDVVVKPIFGAEGRGIFRVSDPDLAVRSFRAIERTAGVIYLQEFVAHPGFDTRILVLDGRVLGGMRRTSDDFRTNIARNGRGEACLLTDEHCDLALRAAAETGSRFAGIDLLQRQDSRLLVLEVNAVPGWKAFTRVTGIDVAQEVIRSLERSRLQASTA